MTECRACGALVDDEGMCPACGASLPGSTESFEPVSSVLSGSGAAVLSSDGPVLVVRKGPETGESFYIDRPSLSIGRDPASDIFLNDMTVSRKHAHLELVDGIVFIHDDASLNGTYVNGVCVDRAQLADGDIVQIGTFQMVFSGGRIGS